MSRIALVRAAMIRPIARFLRRIGAPVDRLLAGAHLTPDVLDDPERCIPAYAATAFIATAARSQGIEHLGALVAETTSVVDLGVYGRRLVQCATLYDLILTAGRLHVGYHSGETYWLDSPGGRPMLCQRFTVHLDDWLLQANQYSVMIALGFILALAEPGYRPRVQLRSGVPRSLTTTRWSERAELVFDQPRFAITVTPHVLHAALPRTDARPLDPSELAAWCHTKPAVDLVASLRQWLGSVLGTGGIHIDAVGATIGVTPRTLQRRLSEAGTSYARVLGQARFDAASRLLARDVMPIRDVARRVGYRDAAHLTRAFRRWSGTTPSQYRRWTRTATAPLREPAPTSGARRIRERIEVVRESMP